MPRRGEAGDIAAAAANVRQPKRGDTVCRRWCVRKDARTKKKRARAVLRQQRVRGDARARQRYAREAQPARQRERAWCVATLPRPTA